MRTAVPVWLVLAATVSARPDAEPPAPLDAAAWRKAGAVVTRRYMSDEYRWLFEVKDAKVLSAAEKASVMYRVEVRKASVLAKLPPVAEPFAMDFSDTAATAADLASLGRFGELRHLTIWHAGDIRAALAQLPSLPKLETLYLGNISLDAAAMKHLRRMTWLRELSLDGPLPAGGVRDLAAMTGLRRLTLPAGTRLDLPSLRALAALPALETLDAGNCEMDEADFPLFGGLKALTELTVPKVKVTPAGARRIGELTNLLRLDFHRCELTDPEVAELAPLKKLRRLILYGPKLSDESAKVIGGFRALTHLTLLVPDITSAGCREIARAKRLECIYFDSAARVTDEGVRHLGGLKALRSLTLYDMPKLTEACAAHLVGLNGLRELGFSGFFVGNKGATHLSTLLGIRKLRVQIDDKPGDALAALANLTAVEWLDVSNSRIDDKAVPHLLKFRRLTSLDLFATPLTAEARTRLAKGLPGCRVRPEPGK